MVMNRDLRIRITKLQHEIIKNKAEIEGKNVSEFCRQRILSNSHKMETMVKDVWQKVCHIPKNI